jgi:hypothetical protein
MPSRSPISGLTLLFPPSPGFRLAVRAGFSTAFQACCGSGGGKYNYQNSARCGMSGASACSNPAAHLSWDGIHLTEAAYKQITDGWLSGAYCSPAILHS